PGGGVPDAPARQATPASQAPRVLPTRPGASRTASPRRTATGCCATGQNTEGEDVVTPAARTATAAALPRKDSQATARDQALWYGHPGPTRRKLFLAPSVHRPSGWHWHRPSGWHRPSWHRPSHLAPSVSWGATLREADQRELSAAITPP